MIARAVVVLLSVLWMLSGAASAQDVDTIYSGLESPWAVGALPQPDMDILVTLMDGRILRLSANGNLVGQFSGVPKTDMLTDILVDRDWTNNHLIYFCHSLGSGTTLTRAKVSGLALVEVGTLITVNWRSTCKLAQSSSGVLYVAWGDPVGQVMDIVPMRSGGIIATGLRQPEGLAFSPDGKLWNHDHGPHGGDELNLIDDGKIGAVRDFGWPRASEGTPFSRDVGVTYKHHEEVPGVTPPVFWWTPAIAPSGMAFWYGDLWIGALKDRSIIRLQLRGDHVVSEERFPMGERVRDVRAADIGHDVMLYVLTDGPNAKLLRVWPAIADYHTIIEVHGR